MSFPVVLLVAGLVLLLIGLLGRIRIKEFEAGTDSKPIRVIIALLGVGLLVGALLAYMPDRPSPPPSIDNANTPNTNMRSLPLGSQTIPIEITIKTPSANETIEVDVESGTAKIPVTGILKELSPSESANTHVYVFTNTRNVSEWWYDKPVNPDQDGDWWTIGLAGSSEQPVKANQTVRIRAIVAKESEIQKATKSTGKKFVESLETIKSLKVSDEVIITIIPKKH